MPLEQLSNNLDFFSYFVASKVGCGGLTVTVDVWKHLTSTNASSQIITAGSATEVGGGLYRYQLSSASVTGEGEYICIFKTSSATPDQKEIPSIWCVQKSGSEYLDAAVTSRGSASDVVAIKTPVVAYLDAGVSSRLAPAGITSLQADVTAIKTPVVANIDATISSRLAAGNVTIAGYASGQDPATLVWAASTRTLSGFGFSVTVGTNNDKTGYALAVTPPTAQQIWDTLTSALSTAGSVGKRIADNLDVTVSSRQASGNVTIAGYAAGQDPVTLTGVTTTRAAKLDNLDTTISSRLAPAGITSLQADVTAIIGNTSPGNSAIYSKVGDAIYYATDARDKALLNYQVLYGVTTPAGSVSANLNAVKSTVDTNLNATVSSRLAASAYQTPVGVGAISYTATLYQPGTTTPIVGAEIWVSSNSTGTTVVAGTLSTNSSGQATFMLDAGSYYLWVQAAGWNFTNPQAFVVS